MSNSAALSNSFQSDPGFEQARRFADPATGKLDLLAVLEGLLLDGLIEESNARLLSSLASQSGGGKDGGALERIASSGWTLPGDEDTNIDLEYLSKWLAKQVGLPWYRIDPLKVDVPAVTAVASSAYAPRFNVICVEVTPEYVVFGTAEPFFDEWQAELTRVLKKEIRLVIVNPEDIKRYLVEFYSLSKSVLGAKQDSAQHSNAVQNLEQLMELGRGGKLEANDSHVVSIVDWLLQYAYEQRASDIHLEPRRNDGGVRFRIDGVMQQVYDMPAAVMAAVTSRLKILGRMDVAEKRRPQDGRLKTRNDQGKDQGEKDKPDNPKQWRAHQSSTVATRAGELAGTSEVVEAPLKPNKAAKAKPTAGTAVENQNPGSMSPNNRAARKFEGSVYQVNPTAAMQPAVAIMTIGPSRHCRAQTASRPQRSEHRQPPQTNH